MITLQDFLKSAGTNYLLSQHPGNYKIDAINDLKEAIKVRYNIEPLNLDHLDMIQFTEYNEANEAKFIDDYYLTYQRLEMMKNLFGFTRSPEPYLIDSMINLISNKGSLFRLTKFIKRGIIFTYYVYNKENDLTCMVVMTNPIKVGDVNAYGVSLLPII